MKKVGLLSLRLHLGRWKGLAKDCRFFEPIEQSTSKKDFEGDIEGEMSSLRVMRSDKKL